MWRGADDAYLNLKYFFSTVVPNLPAGPIYLGNMRNPTIDFFRHHDMEVSSQPALLREVWRTHSFGAYMYGMGFMVSMDVAEFVASWKIPPHLTWCEDVMVGAWLMPFRIQWIDANQYGWSVYNRQDYYSAAAICSNQLLVHYVQQDDWQHIDRHTGNMLFCTW